MNARRRPRMRRLVDNTVALVQSGELSVELAAQKLLENGVPVAVIGRVLAKAVVWASECRQVSIRLSLDDFSTGCASLSYLKSLPLTKVKIDQTFVRSLSESPKDQAITEAVLELADKLDLSVVAEGVETQEQLELLESMGCSQFQGYFFGRPAPIDALDLTREGSVFTKAPPQHLTSAPMFSLEFLCASTYPSAAKNSHFPRGRPLFRLQTPKGGFSIATKYSSRSVATK